MKTSKIAFFLKNTSSSLKKIFSPLISPILRKIKAYKIRNPIHEFFFRTVLKFTRAPIKRFKNLSVISDEAKANIWSTICRYQIQLMVNRYWESVVGNTLIYGPYLTFSVFAVVVLPLLISFSNGAILINFRLYEIISDPNLTSLLLSIIVSGIELGLLGLLLRILSEIFPKTLSIFKILGILLAWIAIASFLYNYVNVSGSLLYLVFSSLLGQITYLVIFAITWELRLVIGFIFFRLRRLRHPDAVIVSKLLHLISCIENAGEHWTDVSVRREILLDIEDVSFCIQHHLSKKLRCGDSTTDLWFEQTTKEIAAALREKKLWVLNPKSDTRFYLVRSISNTLIFIASGDWDALEKIKPEEISIRQTWTETAKSIFRVMFIGGMPIALLWLFQLSPLALGKPISDYVSVGVILWALFTAITTFDPLFGLKIDAIKDIVSILPIPGKNS